MVIAATVNYEQKTVTSPIKITSSAVFKIFQLMQEENNLELKLRIYINGGGCSGLQYAFSFEEKTEPSDIIIEEVVSEELSAETKEDNSKEYNNRTHYLEEKNLPKPIGVVKVIIDALSLEYLRNAKIDYRKNIHGEQFVITNPNAKTTCGCGSSFSADPVDTKE